MAAAEAEGYSSSSRRLPVSSFSVSSSEEINHPHQNPINKIIRNLMNSTRTYGNKRISLLTRPSDHRNVHLQMDECWYSLPHHTTNTQEATTDNSTETHRQTQITTQHRDPQTYRQTHETFTFIFTQNKKRPGALHTTTLPLHCGRGREQK
jgi:hypothetical protein